MDTAAIIGIIIAALFVIGLTVFFLTRRSSPSASNLNDAGQPALVRYFDRLYPAGYEQFRKTDKAKLESLYLSLNAWYETIIPEYKSQILAKVPKWPWNKTLFDQPPGIWCRLFDGDNCDCLRFTVPQCIRPSSRFHSRTLEQDCPEQDGLRVGVGYETILMRAFNSNNTDKNFVADIYTKGGKGFPDNAWFEGLTYIGEYGMPFVCGAIPDSLKGSQPGLQYRATDADAWKPLNLPWNGDPWWDTPCTSTGSCERSGIPIPGLSCYQIKSDGTFPPGSAGTGSYCLYTPDLKESFEPQHRVERITRAGTDDSCKYVTCNNGGKCVGGQCQCVGTYTGPKCDCKNFPTVACSLPSSNGYRGLWLYPLSGVGTFRCIGKSVVANCKLGFLMTTYGESKGYSFDELSALVPGNKAGSLHAQISSLTNILYHGSSRDSKIKSVDLKKFHYKGPIKFRSHSEAQHQAKKTIADWYINGYSGILGDGGQDGFNYAPETYWPMGMYFSYSSSLDNLTLARMVVLEKDTLQIVIEPQSASSGLRPAYFFEIFQATPSSAVVDKYSIFKDTTEVGCKDYYMLNPLEDFDNYTKYGYMSDSAVKTKQLLDPSMMMFSPQAPCFTP